MKPRIDVETSVISYLTARPNRDLIVAVNQQITAEFWEQRADFDIYTSDLVLSAASRATSKRQYSMAQNSIAADGLTFVQ
jgi:hypothetical protein